MQNKELSVSAQVFG